MRLPDLKRITFPETLEEAITLLSDKKRRAVPFSGGVSFIFAPLPAVEELVGLRRLPLDYIKGKNGGLRIGAGTPVSRLVESGAVEKYADGIIHRAARGIGSTLNRNLITVGGNIVQPFIWSDLPAVLLAMNAEVKIRGKTERSLPAEKFFARPPKQLLKDGELVTEVIFPPLPKGTRSSFYAFGLSEIDFALLKVAVRLVRRQRLCREIVIVAGGGTLLPQRLSGAEDILRGKRGSQILVNEVSEKAAEEIRLSKDIRCTQDYKRELCRVMVRAVLEDILLDQKVAEWKLF